jgi:hypothetical protein
MFDVFYCKDEDEKVIPLSEEEDKQGKYLPLKESQILEKIMTEYKACLTGSYPTISKLREKSFFKERETEYDKFMDELHKINNPILITQTNEAKKIAKLREEYIAKKIIEKRQQEKKEINIQQEKQKTQEKINKDIQGDKYINKMPLSQLPLTIEEMKELEQKIKAAEQNAALFKANLIEQQEIQSKLNNELFQNECRFKT